MRSFTCIASDFLDELTTASQRSAKYSQPHFFALGVMSWIIPLAGVVDYIVAEPSFNTMIVRSLVPIFCIPLLLYPRLPPQYIKYFNIYFVSLTAYAFPFSYGIMLSMNAALAPTGEHIHFIWILQYVIALFLFIQLIASGKLATTLWLISSTFALIPVLIISSANVEELQRVLVYPITGYLTALCFGILTNRNAEIIELEKATTASAIGANLAHELRTPLASIRSLSQGVVNILPVLTDAYTKAKESGIAVGVLRRSQVSQLDQALEKIGNEVEYSNTIIDMLLVNTADKPLVDIETNESSAKDCINEAVTRYPFNNQHERDLIKSHTDVDFTVQAPRLLIVHVLFNLIKNSLFFVQKSGHGSIEISTRESEGGFQIVVHDTGLGISANIRQHIFERFYTTSAMGQGAGIGLSFCKMVMDSVGGSIACDSVENEYTTFTLTFPRSTG